MEAIYNTTVQYERMKLYMGMIACIIIGILVIICAIVSIMNPPPPPPPPNQSPSPSPPPTQSISILNILSWPWLVLIGIICFIIAYGNYYMASNKSMENVLAAQGAINAVSSVSSIFDTNRGGMFEAGE